MSFFGKFEKPGKVERCGVDGRASGNFNWSGKFVEMLKNFDQIRKYFERDLLLRNVVSFFCGYKYFFMKYVAIKNNQFRATNVKENWKN